MKCIVCKQGNTQLGTMIATFERFDNTIVFKEVPAEICDNCGEKNTYQKICQRIC